MADRTGSDQPRSLWLAALQVVVSVLVVMLVAACSGDATSQAERTVAPTPIPAPAGVTSDGAELTLAVVDGGPATGLVITDHRGFAVYGVTGETTGELICVDDCLAVWIPVAPREAAVAGELDTSRYGSFTRPDGIEQATYADIPLYLWTGDREIGITGGAGVAGTWFALTAECGFLG